MAMPHRWMGSSDETPATILAALKENPRMTYITRGMNAMYVLHSGDIMMCFVGDFSNMDDAAVNKFLQDSIQEAQNGE